MIPIAKCILVLCPVFLCANLQDGSVREGAEQFEGLHSPERIVHPSDRAGPLIAENLTIQSIQLVQNDEAVGEAFSVDDPIDIRIPCDQTKMRSCLLPYLNQEISEEILQKIKEDLSKEFVAQNDSFILVNIPEQDVSQGNIAIVALPAKVEKIRVRQNRWFSRASIARAMSVSKGDVVCESNLLNGAAAINRNPFIHTDIVVSKGNESGMTDVEVLTKDRFPARFYAGSDNTGSSFSGSTRWFTGVNASLGLNYLLSYQFTSGYSFPEFLSHFGNLTFLLPWKHELVFYGGWATVHPEIEDFTTHGKDVQGSMRYLIPIKPLYTPFEQTLSCGADYKLTNSDLFFFGALPSGAIELIPVNHKLAALFQIYLGYQLSDTWDKLSIDFKIDTFGSPAIFLPHQNELAYNSLRPGADIRYFYARGAFGGTYNLPRCLSLAWLLRGQVASGALLPSEEYGLGGYDTVRGYQERIFLADNAIVGNLELHLAPFSFTRNKIDEFYFLLFIDSAYGINWHANGAFPKDAWLLGVGPGLRYQIAPYLSARVDYGFRIHNTPFANDQLGRIHFSAVVGY